MSRLARALESHLFAAAPANVRTFAVLDGAATPGLLPLLEETNPPRACLFRGNFGPELLAAAPWLVEVGAGSWLFDTLVEDGWGRHRGIWLNALGDVEVLRRHLRRFLRVADEDGRKLLFRYYDPRILRVFLPTTDEAQRRIVSGPVLRWFNESADGDALDAWEVAARELRHTRHPLPDESRPLAGAA